MRSSRPANLILTGRSYRVAPTLVYHTRCGLHEPLAVESYMEYRNLGRTGLKVSVVGFGCGDVGGLMVRGEPGDRTRAVARAIELGINYFDTASTYGKGQSEQNLGRVLNELSPSLSDNVYVGTKVRLDTHKIEDSKVSIIKSVEDSLNRLNRPSVDLIQLHNSVTAHRDPGGDSISVEDVLGQVLEGFRDLQTQGKVRFYGITGFGETEALLRVVDSGSVFSVQSCYNLLNPSSGIPVIADFDLQDFGGLIRRAEAQETGIIVIRVLAAGALTGVEQRHPVAIPHVAPLGSTDSYSEDLIRARALSFLVDEGHVESLVEAAVRFPLGNSGVSTVLVGYSSMEHLEQVVGWMDRGPLSSEAIDRLSDIWGRRG